LKTIQFTPENTVEHTVSKHFKTGTPGGQEADDQASQVYRPDVLLRAPGLCLRPVPALFGVIALRQTIHSRGGLFRCVYVRF
jgi:hypothetical protein